MIAFGKKEKFEQVVKLKNILSLISKPYFLIDFLAISRKKNLKRTIF